MRLLPPLVLGLVAAGASHAQALGAAPAYEAWAWPGRPALAADSLTPSPPPDGWLTRDKQLHFGVSFLLTLSGQYVLTTKGELSEGEALPVAAGAALSIGLLKEVMDSRRALYPHFCPRDLAVDALGVLLAAGLIAL